MQKSKMNNEQLLLQYRLLLRVSVGMAALTAGDQELAVQRCGAGIA